MCRYARHQSQEQQRRQYIYNNETYTIKEIRNKEKLVIVIDYGKEQAVPIAEFTKMFNLAFCSTCHKAQGATFDEPYTIHEFDQFDDRLRYVALSRSTDINLINIILYFIFLNFVNLMKMKLFLL